jgi:hypothetical protein
MVNADERTAAILEGADASRRLRRDSRVVGRAEHQSEHSAEHQFEHGAEHQLEHSAER